MVVKLVRVSERADKFPWRSAGLMGEVCPCFSPCSSLFVPVNPNSNCTIHLTREEWRLVTWVRVRGEEGEGEGRRGEDEKRRGEDEKRGGCKERVRVRGG